ncbi:MAG: hypothetical protein M1833_001973, partial [Piccolia ochrophora]
LLESIKAQKRLPEVRFAVVNTAGCRQRSVYGMFGGNTTTGEALADGNDLGHRELPLGEKKTDAARDNGASSRPR